jgi:hypothetical protein
MAPANHGSAEMTERRLKDRLSLFVITSHFGILVLVIVLWLAGGFLTEEMTTTIAIIAPFLAVYATAVIKYITDERYRVEHEGKPINNIFALVTFAIPSAFVTIVAAAIILKAFNYGLTTFENFKLMLATTETVFGVYVGQLIFSLFERPGAATKKPIRHMRVP